MIKYKRSINGEDMRSKMVCNWASISAEKGALDCVALSGDDTATRLVGSCGRKPVLRCISAASRSNSVAASAPSPTAVTTCRNGLAQTSPAAYSPSTEVFVRGPLPHILVHRIVRYFYQLSGRLISSKNEYTEKITVFCLHFSYFACLGVSITQTT